MSAIGPKRTSLVALHMSAFGSKADSVGHSYEPRLHNVEWRSPRLVTGGSQFTSVPTLMSRRFLAR
jgi:hypothetical protein